MIYDIYMTYIYDKYIYICMYIYNIYMYIYIYICIWYGIDDTGIRDIL